MSEQDEPLKRLEESWAENLTRALEAVALEQDEIVERFAHRARELELEIAHLPARSLVGLEIKLRLLVHGVTVGSTEQDRLLCVSALEDVSALMSRTTDVGRRPDDPAA